VGISLPEILEQQYVLLDLATEQNDTVTQTRTDFLASARSDSNGEVSLAGHGFDEAQR
jgi:hypothetical protein